MNAEQSQLGRRLYQLLPAVYRDRDNSDRNREGIHLDAFNGDLGRYLDACGLLLDLVHQTLRQRLADGFPDNPQPRPDDPDPLACQDWLLPYFADLLDVRLVSPDVRGRRDEIANAVSWRQRKGTIEVIEQIAEAVARMEVEVQEGWKRVAVTPRIGTPLLPAGALGYSSEPVMSNASTASRHPALPAVTVDPRCPSRAVSASESNPTAQRGEVDGVRRVWRQVSPHGTPCFPGSYEDVSRRTVDLRTPDWRVGHFHPRRILLHFPPPAGFFPAGVETVQWTRRDEAPFTDLIEVTRSRRPDGESVITYRNRSFGTDEFLPVRIRRVIELGAGSGGDPSIGIHRFEGLILDNKVTAGGGRVELDTCASRRIESFAADLEAPVFSAVNSLIGNFEAAQGLGRLEYCTVLGETRAELLQASDCIFRDRVRGPNPPPEGPSGGCLRFSRLLKGDLETIRQEGRLSLFQTNSDPVVMHSETFGERSSGVLHPETPASIRFGAEDGGEMGAGHAFRYSLLEEAVRDKVKDFLPIGLEAVLISDARLLEMPVSVEATEE